MGNIGAVAVVIVGFVVGFLGFDLVFGVGYSANQALAQYLCGGLGAIFGLLVVMGKERWR